MHMEQVKKLHIKRRILMYRYNKTMQDIIRYYDATKENIKKIIKVGLKFVNIYTEY